jgi:hypothetical protein
MRRDVALVMVGLAVGCVAGAATTRIAGAQVARSAPARQFCEELRQGTGFEAMNTRIEAYGRQGWDLVAAQRSHNVYDVGLLCFRRAP